MTQNQLLVKVEAQEHMDVDKNTNDAMLTGTNLAKAYSLDQFM